MKNTSLVFAAIVFCIGILNVKADNGKPDLWKIENKGQTSYLFGSIHLGSSDMYPLSEIVEKAYQSSNHLIVEIDLNTVDQSTLMPYIQKFGVNTQSTLESRLTPETLTIYKEACVKKSLSCSQFAPFEAWLLSVQLSVMTFKQLGYKEALGIDKHFLDLAHKSNKNIISLETALAQLKMLSGFDQQQQELMLVQSLQASESEASELFKAWKTGDDISLINMFNKDIEQPGAKGIYQSMFTDRNQLMADKVDKYLSENKSLFVVVGAGHVVGETGLVISLRNRGYTVTQIQ